MTNFAPPLLLTWCAEERLYALPSTVLCTLLLSLFFPTVHAPGAGARNVLEPSVVLRPCQAVSAKRTYVHHRPSYLVNSTVPSIWRIWWLLAGGFNSVFRSSKFLSSLLTFLGILSLLSLFPCFISHSSFLFLYFCSFRLPSLFISLPLTYIPYLFILSLPILKWKYFRCFFLYTFPTAFFPLPFLLPHSSPFQGSFPFYVPRLRPFPLLKVDFEMKTLMDHGWNNPEKKCQNYSENVSQCHCLNHRPNLVWRVTEPPPTAWRLPPYVQVLFCRMFAAIRLVHLLWVVLTWKCVWIFFLRDGLVRGDRSIL